MKRSYTTLALLLFATGLFAQNLVGVNPNSGSTGQSLNVSLSGQNTQFAQGSNTVWFNMGTLTYFGMYNPIATSNTAIQGDVHIPAFAPAGMYDVHVQTSTQGVLSLPNSFEVFASYPHIKRVTPAYAHQGQNLSVKVTTQNAHFTMGTNTSVFFTQGSYTLMGTNTVVMNDNYVKTDINVPHSAPDGWYTTFTQNMINGTLYKHNSFHVHSDMGATLFPNKTKEGKSILVYVYNKPYGAHSVELVHGTTSFSITLGMLFGHTALPANLPVGCYDMKVLNSSGNVLELVSCALEIAPANNAIIDSIGVDNQHYAKMRVYGENTHFLSGDNTVVPFCDMAMQQIIRIDSCVAVSDNILDVYGEFLIFTMVKSGIVQLPGGLKVYNTVDHELSYPVNYWTFVDVKDVHKSSILNHYPNPSNGMVTLEIEDQNERIELHVYSMLGKKVLTQSYEPYDQVRVDLSSFPKGNYLIRVIGNKTFGSVVVTKAD